MVGPTGRLDRAVRSHDLGAARLDSLMPGDSSPERSSSKTSPSRIRMMRPAWAATVGSCVTRTIVSPSSWLSWRKRSRISSPVFESRLPVGSSAIRREQPVDERSGNRHALLLAT